MSARLDLEAPTFTSLNKPQKRALILRDQLRYVDPAHLNSFIEGITDDEPPTYTKINGVIKPELTFVTLKEEATRFDLGNVILPEERNAIYRVHFIVDNGQIEMRAGEPLPLDENLFDSVPIHGFIARQTVNMFKDKYHAIFTRMNKINEARRAAYNMPNLPPVMFHDGETLARLDPSTFEQDSNQVARRTRKREPNDQVTQHISNKRKRNGLASIPEDEKSKIFDTIPSRVKVDLFNSMVKTAFPNFDNLMVASWNVVSVYSACGSDFPELHRSIVELKGVLQDFDEATGERVDRVAPAYRHDFGGPSRTSSNEGRQNGTHMNEHHSNQDHPTGDRSNGGHINEDRLISSAPTHTQNVADAGNQVSQPAANENENENENENAQQQDEISAAVELFGDDEDRTEAEMPPPRVMLLTQPQEKLAEEEEDDDDDEIPAVDPRLNAQSDRQSNVHQHRAEDMADPRLGRSVQSSSETTPEPEPTPTPYARVKTIREQKGFTMPSSSKTTPEPPARLVSRDRSTKIREQNPEASTDKRDVVAPHASSPELVRRREEYASSIGKVSALANLRAPTPVLSSHTDDMDSPSEHGRPAPLLHDRPAPTPNSTSTPKPTTKEKKKKKSMTELTTEQIKTRLAERKRELLKTFSTLDQVPETKMMQIKHLEAALLNRERSKARTREREREREQADVGNEDKRPSNNTGGGNGMFGSYLGNSVLGAKKPTGVAPVAPMIPMGVNRDGYTASDRYGIGGSPPRGRRPY